MRTGGEDNLKFLAQLNWNTIRVRVKGMHLVLDVLDVLHERLSRMYEHEDDYDSNVILLNTSQKRLRDLIHSGWQCQ